MGFALIWHIWWMVVAGAIGAFATFVVFAWRDHDEDTIPAAEVARVDGSNRVQRQAILSKVAAE
jgi:cytochrome o ubiquinol oxidase subunit 1